jgi:hypothetical protein
MNLKSGTRTIAITLSPQSQRGSSSERRNTAGVDPRRKNRRNNSQTSKDIGLGEFGLRPTINWMQRKKEAME